MSTHTAQYNVADESNLFDIFIEQALLGALIVDNNKFSDIDGVLDAECFSDPLHQRIFALISSSLEKQGGIVSPLTINAAMKTDPGLAEVGGHAYLINMVMASPANANVLALAKVIRNYKSRRDAMDALLASVEMVKQAHTPLMDALKPAQEAADCAADDAARDTIVSTSEAVTSILAELQDAMNGKPVPKITTGFKELDEALGGLQAADFCILAGRPGMMKTGVAGNIALAAAASGAPVLFFEQEMTRKQLIERMGCGIDFTQHPDDPMSYNWVRNGNLRDYQFERLMLAMQHIPDRLRILDRSGMTIHEIAGYSRAFAKSQTQMGLIIIDYLQLVRAGDRYKGNMVQEVTEISKACKTLAKTIGWPVLVLSQLSRQCETRDDKRPLMTDLRESGQLEQDADSIIMLYRHSYYLEQELQNSKCPNRADKEAELEACKDEIELLIRKNRHGRSRVVTAYCNLQSSAVLDKKPMGAR